MFGFNVKFEAIFRSVVRACARTNVVTRDYTVDMQEIRNSGSVVSLTIRACFNDFPVGGGGQFRKRDRHNDDNNI